MKFSIRDYNYIVIIIALMLTVTALYVERKGQISVCYDVFENIISKET